jgi:hypothetical protein
MAHLHVAQIAYLTQDLIEHIHNANNLLYRCKYELGRIQQTTQMLATAHDELEKDLEFEQNFK